MAEPTPFPAAPKIDRAALLGSFYQYLGARADSIGRRSSLTMAFLASFLGFATSPVLRGETPTASAKLAFALSHPSILIGVLGMGILLYSELARIKKSDDLFSRIAFTDESISELKSAYTQSPIDALLENMVANTRVVGGFVRKKLRLYNVGCALFVVSVVLFVFGY